MKEKAFTLIEVMVVMAIISVLAGMMVPAVWKFWESEEIATTRERMREIKKGLVGDKSLVQNGVRTHYGFVGDNGELPFGNMTAAGGLKYLADRPASGYPNWTGPYLSGFGPEWYRDAWGNAFRYYLTKDAHGRYVSAELRSAGPDGIFDNSDDIVDTDVQIFDREVTPTNRIKGNTYGTYSSFSGLHLIMKFKDPIDPSGTTTQTLCKQLSVASRFSNYTTLLLDSSSNPLKLPVGGVEITTSLHYKSDCSDAPKSPNSLLYFVSDAINQIILPELR